MEPTTPATPATPSMPDPWAAAEAQSSNKPDIEGMKAELEGKAKKEPPKTDKKEQKDPPKNDNSSKKWKLKIDGAEEEVDEPELIRRAQIGQAGYKRMQEAASKQKELEAKFKEFEADPIKFFSKSGKDFREVAEQFLIGELEKEQMSPEQRRLRELEARVKEQEEKERQIKEDMEKQELTRQEQRFAEEYDRGVAKALESTGLPRDPYTVKRMANYMLEALENDIDLSPDEAALMVQEDYQKELKSFLNSLDDPTSFLGEELMGRFRKSDLAKVKAQPQHTPKNSDERPQPKQQKRLTMEEFKQAVADRMR